MKIERITINKIPSILWGEKRNSVMKKKRKWR